MLDKMFQVVSALTLEELLASLPPPKFNLRDRVRWFRVPTQDFGVVIDSFYGTEVSVQAIGWHYAIQLDPNSPSSAHCKIDWGFEEDLAFMELGDADAVE